MNLRPLVLLAVCFLAAPRPLAAAPPPLRVESDFDNGNGVAVDIDQDRRVITVAPLQIAGARNIWWHFRILGIEPGETIEVRLVDFDPVARQVHPVFSYDGASWHRMEDAATPHRQRFDRAAVWIARNLPYTYGDALRLSAELARSPHADVSDLCVSEGGRRVPLFRFTDHRVPEHDKQLVWVVARQHAFESHSSRVAQGLARWLAGTSPEAAAVRRARVVCVAPLMDVDGVFQGGAGKDQQPVDFNRSWAPDSPWAAVRAVMARLAHDQARTPLIAFFDLHSPWYDETSHWHVWGGEALEAAARRQGQALEAGLRALAAPNRWENRFVVSLAPYDARAQRFVARHRLASLPGAVSMTMEIPHWRDADGKFMVAEGLDALGAALGYSLQPLP